MVTLLSKAMHNERDGKGPEGKGREGTGVEGSVRVGKGRVGKANKTIEIFKKIVVREMCQNFACMNFFSYHLVRSLGLYEL